MKLIILGAPGAGKGTQAVLLAECFNIEHISTGDMLRDEMRRNTAIGQSISQIMGSGQFVPDETVIQMLAAHVAEQQDTDGYILDGFPRNLHQAEVLEEMGIHIDKAIEVVVDDELIAVRVSGRRICPVCGGTYHIQYKQPITPGVCDTCQATLVQREDDDHQTVINRLALYHEQTEPIVEFYRKNDLLITVSGVGDVEEILQSICAALGVKV